MPLLAFVKYCLFDKRIKKHIYDDTEKKGEIAVLLELAFAFSFTSCLEYIAEEEAEWDEDHDTFEPDYTVDQDARTETSWLKGYGAK